MTAINLGAERAKRADDNTGIAPADCCEAAASDIRSGERKANKVLVLTLDNEGGAYSTGWYAANMASSEMIALMEAAKAMLLRDMGY